MTNSVRDATEVDVDAIRAVGRTAWPVTYAFAGEDYVAHGLTTWWSDSAVRTGLVTTTTLVATADGVVVGMGNVDLRQDVPVIWKLYVLPAHQGEGHGGRLVTALVDRARGRGAVELSYTDGNRRAAAFYAAHGFVEVRRRADERAGWPDQVWLRRQTTKTQNG